MQEPGGLFDRWDGAGLIIPILNRTGESGPAEWVVLPVVLNYEQGGSRSLLCRLETRSAMFFVFISTVLKRLVVLCKCMILTHFQAVEYCLRLATHVTVPPTGSPRESADGRHRHSSSIKMPRQELRAHNLLYCSLHLTLDFIVLEIPNVFILLDGETS